MDHANIQGHGADAEPGNRPGIPMESPPPGVRPGRSVPFQEAARPAVPVSGRSDRTFPPVYGTAQPPRGLSGAIRTYAYRKYPPHLKRRWLTLLFADRVDIWEHRLGSLGGLAAIGALFLVGRYAGGMFRG